MRLLHVEPNGTFSLAEYFGDEVPSYAILSHTWGSDNEEVSFKDLTEGRGSNKKGYEKLTFCARQALYDGLRYFWVDTCCIDKSSSAELSEAINSMFRWYEEAIICYVFLVDVRASAFDGTEWKAAFRSSRWFTRGWTLQELLAPTIVDFFDVNGQRLGSKLTLRRDIQMATGIPALALEEDTLHMFTVNERMSWARGRQTRREEDYAYCLFGICDVHMPLIYGEGKKSAYMRLQRAIHEMSDQDSVDMRVFDATPSTISQQSAYITNTGSDTDSSSQVPVSRQTLGNSGEPETDRGESVRSMIASSVLPAPSQPRETLRLWTVKRSPNAASWDGAQAAQQQPAPGELRQRSSQADPSSVKAQLKEIPSQTAHRRLNELVEDENQAIAQTHPNWSWFIASVDLQWKGNDRRRRQLDQIVVLLQAQSAEIPTTPNTPPDPVYTFWVIRKRIGVVSWREGAEILQQHLSQASLREEVRRFEGQRTSVDSALAAVHPAQALRLLHELLLEQNHAALTGPGTSALWVVIAVKLKWRTITTRMRQLKDIEVVLQLKKDAGTSG